MESSGQREAISQKLERQLRYMILDASNADRTISFLLEHDIGLDMLVFCRCRVKSSDLAAELEERILERSFRPFMILKDLIAIEGSLYNSRLKQRLHSLAQSLLNGEQGYFPFPWLIAQKYPDLREKAGEYLLAEEFLDVTQVYVSMKYFSKDLQEKLMQRIRSEDLYRAFELLQK